MTDTIDKVLTSKDITFTAGNHRYHITDTKPKVYIPSVTTICGLLDKPFLVEWAAREAATEAALAVASADKLDETTIAACVAVGRQKHRDLRTQGANVGTAVHHRIKMLLVPGWEPAEGERIELEGAFQMEADLAFDAFVDWWQDAQLDGWEVVYCERIVVHPLGGYVGTFDLLLRNRNTGEYRLVDFKTSNQSEDNPLALYPEYLLQTAAYRQAILHSPEYEVDALPAATILALGKQGQLGVTTIDAPDLERYADTFNLLAAVIDDYRYAQRQIRALNKVEKARRAEEADGE